MPQTVLRSQYDFPFGLGSPACCKRRQTSPRLARSRPIQATICWTTRAAVDKFRLLTVLVWLASAVSETLVIRGRSSRPRLEFGPFLLMAGELGESLGTSKSWILRPCYWTAFWLSSASGALCSGKNAVSAARCAKRWVP